MEILDSNDKLFQECIDTWGIDCQYEMASEEMGELIEQLGKTISKMNKYKRQRIEDVELIGEFVDVFLIMQQVRYMNKEVWDRIYGEKVNFLKERISKHDRSNNQ